MRTRDVPHHNFFEECRWVIEEFENANILLLAGDGDKANNLYDVFESSKILPRNSTKNQIAHTMCANPSPPTTQALPTNQRPPHDPCRDICYGFTNNITIGNGTTVTPAPSSASSSSSDGTTVTPAPYSETKKEALQRVTVDAVLSDADMNAIMLLLGLIN